MSRPAILKDVSRLPTLPFVVISTLKKTRCSRPRTTYSKTSTAGAANGNGLAHGLGTVRDGIGGIGEIALAIAAGMVWHGLA